MFELGAGVWRRRGWAEMDAMRARLEDLRELRDLVRSLGRGGGWGPLRRAPVQKLDARGRPGLLRTVLEAQETRGLTRTDDISRLLPSEARRVLGGGGVVGVEGWGLGLELGLRLWSVGPRLGG